MARLKLLFFALSQRAWELLRSILRTILGRRGLASLMEKTGLHALKNRFWRFEIELADGNKLLYRPQDQCIIEEIYAREVYTRGAPIRAGETVLDLGGHIGVFTLFAALRVGPHGRVVVCEPGPKNLELLRRNIARNHLDQVRLHPCAVADQDGEADFYIAADPADNPVADTLTPAAGRSAIRVKLRTLDGIIAQEGITAIDHLKIDVEGAEERVLDGGAKALAMAKRVMMEIHPPRVDPEEMIARLERLGFKVRVVSRTPFVVEAERPCPS